MDLSKLPKLSETRPPESADATDAPKESPLTVLRTSDLDQRRYEPSGIGGEVWLGIVIALILMLYTRSFGGYLLSLAAGKPFDTGFVWSEGPNQGQPVPYTQLEGGTFYSDSSIFLFGVAMLIGALAQIVLASRFGGKRAIAWLSLGAMAMATVYNIVAAIILLRVGITPLISLLCVAVGGYIVYYEWAAIRATSHAPN